MKREELIKLIDHTNVKPEASIRDIKRLCQEAKRYQFQCVCVNPFFTKVAAKLLKGSKVKTGATCGFPFGSHCTEVKVYEAEKAIKDGAREIDMVINIGALKSRQYKLARDDVKRVVNICRKNRVISKVILEMNLLTAKEKIVACKIVRDAGADFIKTGTGFWGPAKLADVRLMKKIAQNKCAVKAAGGIRTYSQVQRFVKAGAERIGTSCGARIVKDFDKINRKNR